MQDFTNRHIGEIRKVLFENPDKNGMAEGYTDNYIKITAPHKKEWTNNIVEWKI
jgi:threonylcarbamoyladenosine tRNA methylthiotransferase MtaB